MNIVSGRYFSSNGQGGIWTIVRESPTSDLQQRGLHLSNKNAAPKDERRLVMLVASCSNQSQQRRRLGFSVHSP